MPLIKTGKIDVMMVAMNFVDRHTYGFETKVLAGRAGVRTGDRLHESLRRHEGGIRSCRRARTPGPMIQSKMKRTGRPLRARPCPTWPRCVIGPHTVEQLRENVQLVKDYQPLSDEELACC